MLLKRGDIAPNTGDENGLTPLYWAVVKWKVDIMRTLLERKDVYPKTVDKYGLTPLSLAAGRG